MYFRSKFFSYAFRYRLRMFIMEKLTVHVKNIILQIREVWAHNIILIPPIFSKVLLNARKVSDHVNVCSRCVWSVYFASFYDYSIGILKVWCWCWISGNVPTSVVFFNGLWFTKIFLNLTLIILNKIIN
jgi:hypothetical protein